MYCVSAWQFSLLWKFSDPLFSGVVRAVQGSKKKKKESQDYSTERGEITYFIPWSHITADYRARTRWKVVLNIADIRQSECLFNDGPGKQLEN